MTIFAASVCLLIAFGVGPDPRDAIRRAAELYGRQRYEEALAALDSVGERVDARLRPAWLFDRAATLYRLGRIDDARESWTQAASQADPALEAACRYNLGNCDYRQALAAANNPQQAAAALELIERAIENYRDAIRLDPALEDARANLELATRLREQLRRQMQQQPQQQNSPAPSSQPSKNNRPQQQQQQQDSSQNRQRSQQPSSDRRQDGADRDRSQRQDSPQQDAESQDQQRREAQPLPPKPEPSASQPAQPPRDARGRPLRLTREQAERLLQLIRDLERQRREMLRRMQAARQKPVDRDW